ncbi:MAG: hypothetical protein II372_03635 [Clostridia bacterium]|nr:hypothetical protein [Clostridia bacterium]
MKEIYLDIMEKALSAYTSERIRDYIDEVKRDGLREHGFPRLGVITGILISYGRCRHLKDVFIEIMDICFDEMPRRKAQNDFSVREACCLLMLLKGKSIVSEEQIQKWTSRMAQFDPWQMYNVIAPSPDTPNVSNWAMFAGISDFVRGELCGIDTSEFVEWQISSQLLNFDENGMYQDDAPLKNPMVYDIVPRLLLDFLLAFGYKGKFKTQIEEILDKSAQLTLLMQSSTGEMSFDGRSNQFIHNETMLISFYELEALRFARKGDTARAGEFKAAAQLSAQRVLEDLSAEPITHVKNRYPTETFYGCEPYAYFNKYMITVASNLYMGAMFADDSIVPTVAPALVGGYVATTSEHFHKVFLSACGYTAQIETNADTHYDGNGIGRIHKAGCPTALCLSVPFPAKNPNYKVEKENNSEMSLCCYAQSGEKLLVGAKAGTKYTLKSKDSNENMASATFEVLLSKDVAVEQKISLCENGVDVYLEGDGNIGFMVPVFDFDGKNHTEITQTKNSIQVKYKNCYCSFGFEGDTFSEHEIYYNRNGRYRVYRIAARHLHIVIGGVLI